SNAAQLIVTYEWRPPTPTTIIGPADDATVTTTRPTLSVGAVTDNDPGDTVKYWFKVWTNPDMEGAGQVINSGWLTSPSWTPPAEYLTDGGTYYWNVVASDTESAPTPPTPTRSFNIDTQLGAGGLSDGMGPVGVNMTSGNGMFSLNGPGGVSLAYNTTDAPTTGLTGYYYQDTNSNQTFDDALKLSRLDSTVGFNWALTTSPDASLTEDNFLVRWEGTVTVPQTGSWEFGTPIDDRARVWVNGTQVLNKWGTSDASATTVWGTAASLTANTPYTIKVEYYENTGTGAVNLQAKGPGSYAAGLDVPTSWLLPKERVPQQAPAGWTAAIDGGAAYTSVVATNDVAVVMSGDASVLEFGRVGNGFTPPEGSEATLSTDANGRYVLVEGGLRYVFNADGTLAIVQSASADGAQVPKYEYTTITGPDGKIHPRLASVTDPNTTRTVTYTWSGGGTCPVPTGYYTPPPGMLCKAVDWDGSTTEINYSILGRIVRLVADPDSGTSNDESVTSLGYDSCGRPSAWRDPLSNATVAAGYAVLDATTRHTIAYEPSSCDGWVWDDKVASVTGPAPTSGASQPQTSWTYGTGQTDTHIAGLTEPLGYARRVTYNSAGQLLTDTDATGLVTTSIYDNQDRLVSTIDPTGLKTTTVYNARDLPTDEWGPAPSSYWTNSTDIGAPTAAQQAATPHTTHSHDEFIKSLAASWFNTETVSPDTSTTATSSQRETALATGVGTTGGEIDKTWTGGTTPPGVTDASTMSGELSGLITFGTAGAHQLKLSRHQRVKLWIDDQEVITAWDDGSTDTAAYTLTTTTANESHRIRIQLANTNDTTATIKLWWDLPTTGTNWVVVPGTSLAPDYGLETSTTDPDGRTTSFDYTDTAKNIGPHHGAVVTTNRFPGGFDILADTNVYTDPTIGDLTQTGRQLPTGAGSEVTYETYGDTETKDDPCTVPVDPVSQGGAPKLRTDADPDGVGGTAPIAYETVYDADGRTVAGRKNSDSWTCTTYDSQGRPAQVDYPAFGGASARTVTYNWTVGGNPLISSVTDPAGTITTMVDLLGRTVEYQDVWGTLTQITYDQAGRESGNTSPAGTFAKTYDAAGRLDTLTLGGNLLADVTYTTGRPTRVDYPSGTGNAGNGTYGLFTYDALGRQSLLKWKQPSALMITHDEITSRSLAGLVLDNKIDNVDPSTSNPSYVYDNAGRLTTARTPGSHTYNYAYARTGGCGLATAGGKNTNRTSKTVDGGTPITYCYDHADRLTSSSDTAVGTITYDSHGSATGIFGETHAYDASDRHLSTTKSAPTVTYTRDATDRIVDRKVNGTTSARYGFTASTDSPSVTLDTIGNVIEELIALPGGAMLTTRAGGNVWSYPNLHGDMVGAANQAGIKQGTTVAFDPDGGALSATIDNAAGSVDYGWVGMYRRPEERESSLEPMAEMGARQYSSRLGRFLELDSIEKGSANGYDYVSADPVNFEDPTGLCDTFSVSCIIGILKAQRRLPVYFLAWAGRRCRCNYVVAGNASRWWYQGGGCSPHSVVNSGPGYNFTTPCKTHDLGYDLIRYFAAVGLNVRRSVDSLFYTDMKNHCGGRSWFEKPSCYNFALWYYAIVNGNSARQHWGIP
ncbi:MAG: phospholipase A2, partial [Acidimicrobiales bacterium]